MSGDDMASFSGSGIGLILFMGRRTEHALTAIQKYVPEVVHIVTSDQFASGHTKRLSQWSEKYSFRKGHVKFIDDLFEDSSVTSILNHVISIYDEELNLHKSELNWRLGITGGTMNMAATGGYVGMLLNMKLFYVIQPPEGASPMPNRDVIEFPQFQGLGWMLNIPPEMVMYLNMKSGNMHEFAKIIPENTFINLLNSDLIIIENDRWFLTEEGNKILEFVLDTPLLSKLEQTMKSALEQKEGKTEKMSQEIKDSYIGWA